MKATTKQAAHYLSLYNRSNYDSVNGFYQKASSAKQRAEHFILMNMDENDGFGYRILNGNCFTFTAAWRRGKNLIVELPTRQIVIESAFEA